MIYVVAGTHQQYKDYLRMSGKTPDEARYVYSPRTLMGVERGSEYVIYGTAFLRKDFFDIERLLNERQMQELRP